MKITLVCHDIPFPPRHGGRVDMWRRIQAFAKYGIDLQLICWTSEEPTSEHLQKIQEHVSNLYLIRYKRDLVTLVYRLLDLIHYPLEVGSRIVRGQELSCLTNQVQEFHPNLIWLDGIHGGEIAKYLSQKFNLPLITRSHNIEHLYLQRLKSSATGLTKIKKTLSANHLETYEKDILKRSALFYDISNDDLKFWQEQGFANGRYLPPFIDINNFYETSSPAEKQDIKYDIVFLGNLFSSNNVAGVNWLIQQVIPKVRQQLPNLKALIAGANPVSSIQKLCAETTGVELYMNPESTQQVYDSGRILVNPVLAGSGVCIKSLEMLSAHKPIVSTPQGIHGLSPEIKKYFYIAEEAESFANQIIDLLINNYQPPKIDINLLNSQFGTSRIESLLSDLQALT